MGNSLVGEMLKVGGRVVRDPHLFPLGARESTWPHAWPTEHRDVAAPYTDFRDSEIAPPVVNVAR